MFRMKVLLALCLLWVIHSSSAMAQPSLDEKLVTRAKRAVDKGLRFLRGQQHKNGSYGKHVGLTGMTLMAYGDSHRGYRHGDGPYVGRAAEWLLKQARADGAITGDATPT